MTTRISGTATVGETTVCNQDLAKWLLQSFRYCLGRMTYTVGDCVEDLQRYWHLMPTAWQVQIQNDIVTAIAMNRAGQACDIADWRKILELPIKDDPK